MTTWLLLLLIGAVFGCLMLTFGFVGGIWFSQAEVRRIRSAPAGPESAEIEELARQRASILSSSLMQLAQLVSGNIHDHSRQVDAISADLRRIDPALPQARELFLSIPERLLAANLVLQDQLATAKQRIETQAAELRVRASEARTDLLTALFNRRAFEEELPRQMALWERKQTPFALLLLDIDHFKRFNDSHGHQVGDDVLRKVAQTICSQLRETDTAYRYGGEEFVVLLPSTPVSDAGLVAERIRAAIEATRLSVPGKDLSVTASVGISSPDAGDQAQGLIRRADEALYRAKQSGRNRVCEHDGRQIRAFQVSGPTNANPPSDREQDASWAEVMSAFHRQLTRYVCESRRLQHPLTLIDLRMGPPSLGGVTPDMPADETALQAINQLKNALPPHTLTPIGTAEFVAIVPDCAVAVATRAIEAALRSRVLDSSVQLRYAACELEPFETAEELLVRTRQGVKWEPELAVK